MTRLESNTTRVYNYRSPSVSGSSTGGVAFNFRWRFTGANFISNNGNLLSANIGASNRAIITQFCLTMPGFGGTFGGLTFTSSVSTGTTTMTTNTWTGGAIDLGNTTPIFAAVFSITSSPVTTSTTTNPILTVLRARLNFRVFCVTMRDVTYKSDRRPEQIPELWRPGNGAYPFWKKGGRLWYSMYYREKFNL